MEAMGTRKISADIEECIQSATKFVLIVSPYLKIAPSLYERMLERLDQGIRIILLYGKVDNNLVDYPRLRNHPSVSIYYLLNLHAKAYVNESGVLLASMNLHSFSEVNNWELGVFFEYGTEMHQAVMKEITFMLKAAEHRFGIEDFNSIRPDAKAEAMISTIQSRAKNLVLKKYVLPSVDDSVEFSFKAMPKNDRNVEMIFYGNSLSILLMNDQAAARVKALFAAVVFKTGLRFYEQKQEITVYPPDGFNARTRDMPDEEFEAMWLAIMVDVDSVFAATSQ